MKTKINQMFKDKLFLVMLVLGLLTIVAAAGVITIQRGKGNENEPEKIIADEIAQETDMYTAGRSEAVAAEETEKANDENVNEVLTQETSKEESEPAALAGAGKNAASALVLNFTDTSKMAWPVQGNVLMGYSMDSTVYFATLDQYKCNPAMIIQADVSTPVAAPANARVMEIGVNEEIGNYVILDMGNEYTAVCGQLKELQVVENEYIEQGKIIGYVAEPTKYYSIEGNNVFFEMKHKDSAVDPLDYMQ